MQKRKYRVHLHSRPGMWEVYDGHVDVPAVNDIDAEDRAIDKLRHTSFPDRPRDSWLIDRVELLPS